MVYLWLIDFISYFVYKNNVNVNPYKEDLEIEKNNKLIKDEKIIDAEFEEKQ